MIPAAFSYTRATSVDEALRLLAADDGAKVIAGGQSLLPLMKLRLASADTLVDIGRLAELKGVSKLEDGRLAVGALTTYAELIDSPAIHYGVLKDALPSIGDVQVRNLGHGGRRRRPRGPGLGPPGGAARARRGDRPPVRVGDAEPSRPTGSSRARSRRRPARTSC